MCVSVCVLVLGRGVENEEGREGILVRIDVEGSGRKMPKMKSIISFYLHFRPTISSLAHLSLPLRFFITFINYTRS